MNDAIMFFLVIGSYSTADKEGVFVYELNTETGKTAYVSSLSGLANPSYLAISDDEQFVYAVSESGENSSAAALAFDKQTGNLILLNRQPTQSPDPCFVLTDTDRNFVVTANYSGGSLSVFPVDDDGSLKPMSQFFGFYPESHLHTAIASPDKRFIFATDLGKDRIYAFDVKADADGDGKVLTPRETGVVSVHPGAGPRHIAFHPNSKYAYCINELDGTISCFSYSAGQLSEFQQIASDTVEHKGTKGSADIHIGTDGKFLYASNRLKNDGIAIFRVDEETGRLTPVGYQQTGIHPRNFIITPNGRFLLAANQNSNTIQVFSIDPATGLLTDTKQDITAVQKPVCLKLIRKD